MKIKPSWLAVAFLLGVAAGGFLAFKLFGPSPKYWVKREAYDLKVQELQKATNAALAVIAEKDQVIEQGSKDILEARRRQFELEQEAVVDEAQIGELEAENKRLKEAVPAEIMSHPAVVAMVANYEARIRAERERGFNLAGQLAEEKKISSAWEMKFWAKDAQYREAMKGWALERETRKAAEGLFHDLELSLNISKFWKWAGWGTAAVVGGIHLYSKLRRSGQ